jgi:hypothetical protein
MRLYGAPLVKGLDQEPILHRPEHENRAGVLGIADPAGRFQDRTDMHWARLTAGRGIGRPKYAGRDEARWLCAESATLVITATEHRRW